MSQICLLSEFVFIIYLSICFVLGLLFFISTYFKVSLDNRINQAPKCQFKCHTVYKVNTEGQALKRTKKSTDSTGRTDGGSIVHMVLAEETTADKFLISFTCVGIRPCAVVEYTVFSFDQCRLYF